MSTQPDHTLFEEGSIPIQRIIALISENRITAITGPPGGGKTALATQVASALGGQVVRISHRTSPSDASAKVDHLLASTEIHGSLLCLDEAEALLDAWPQALTNWLHADAAHRILLTSRHRGCRPDFTWVEVPALGLEEALRVLDPWSPHTPDLRRIAQTLRHSPTLLRAAAEALEIVTAREVATMTTSGSGLAELANWAGLSPKTWIAPKLSPQQNSLLLGCAELPGGAPIDLLRPQFAEANPVGIRTLANLGLLTLLRPRAQVSAYVVLPATVRAALFDQAAPPSDATVSWAVNQATALNTGGELIDVGPHSTRDSLAAVCQATVQHAPQDAATIGIALANHAQEGWTWLDGESILSQLAEHTELDETHRARTCLALALLLGNQGNKKAKDLLSQAYTLAASGEDVRLQVDAAQAYGARLVIDGERERGTLILMSGLENARSARRFDLEGQLLCQLGGYHASEGMYRTGLELMDQALRMLQLAGEATRANDVNRFRAELLGAMGQTEEAIEVMQRCRHAEGPGGPRHQHIYAALLLRNNAPEARAMLTQTREAYLAEGRLYEAARVETDIAVWIAVNGRPTEGEVRARGALDQLTHMGMMAYEVEAWLKLALIELWRADWTAARRSLAEVRWRAGTRFPVWASRCHTLSAALDPPDSTPNTPLGRLAHRTIGEDPILDQLLAALAQIPSDPTDEQQVLAAQSAWITLENTNNVVTRVLARTLLRRLDEGLLCHAARLPTPKPSLTRFVDAARAVSRALATGQLERATQATAHLVQIAKQSGIARLEANARFWTWATGPRDAATLLTLAQPDFPGHRARRRARALLSLPSPLDLEDEDVLRTLTPHLAWTIRSSGPASDAVPYLLDHTRFELVHPDGGRTPLLEGSLLFRILQQLARPRSQSKEALSVGLWPHESYHPLLHGNRLRVAVHRLRRLGLEDLVQTTEDGYTLGHAMLEVIRQNDNTEHMNWTRVSSKLTPSGQRRRDT